MKAPAKLHHPKEDREAGQLWIQKHHRFHQNLISNEFHDASTGWAGRPKVGGGGSSTISDLKSSAWLTVGYLITSTAHPLFPITTSSCEVITLKAEVGYTRSDVDRCYESLSLHKESIAKSDKIKMIKMRGTVSEG